MKLCSESPLEFIPLFRVFQTREGLCHRVLERPFMDSVTVCSLVNDGMCGEEDVIPLPNIHAQVFVFLVKFMETKDLDVFLPVSYNVFIGLIIAANYLDIRWEKEKEEKVLLDMLIKTFKKRYSIERLLEDSPLYKMENCPESFSENMREFISRHNKPFMHGVDVLPLLTEISKPSDGELVSFPDEVDNLRLYHLNKDLLCNKIFPNFQDIKNRRGYTPTHLISALLLFRSMHRRLWHPTSEYICNLALQIYGDTVNLDMNDRFNFTYMFLSYEGGKPTYTEFGITTHQVKEHCPEFVLAENKDNKEAILCAFIHTALCVHDTLDDMKAAVKKKRDRAVLVRIAREKKKEEEEKKELKRKREEKEEEDRQREIRSANGIFFRNECEKLGYAISDHDFRSGWSFPSFQLVTSTKDTAFQEYLTHIREEIDSLVAQKEYGLIRKLVTREKFLELLPTWDDGNDEKIDNDHIELLNFLKENGYLVQLSELNGLRDKEECLEYLESRCKNDDYYLRMHTTFEKYIDFITNREKQQFERALHVKTILEENGYFYTISEIHRLFHVGSIMPQDILGIASGDIRRDILSGNLYYVEKHTSRKRYKQALADF